MGQVIFPRKGQLNGAQRGRSSSSDSSGGPSGAAAAITLVAAGRHGWWQQEQLLEQQWCAMSPRQPTVPPAPSHSWTGPAPRGSFHHGLNLTPCCVLGACEHPVEGTAGTHGAGPKSIGFICAGLTRATVPPAPRPPPMGKCGEEEGSHQSLPPGASQSPPPWELPQWSQS